jgi:signal peptidase I
MIDGTEAPPARPGPKPLLALAGGLTMPGLGHVYLGEPVRGALFLLAIALAVPGAARLGLAAPLRLLSLVTSLGVATAVGLYVWSVADAFQRARRSIVGASPWRRLGVYILYAAVGYAWVLIPSTAYVRDDLLETFVVPTGSMAPAVLPGDRILADKRMGRGGIKLWRGALAIFVYPNDRTTVFIKRVIGLPGDRVEVEGVKLRVNGQDVGAPARPAEGSATVVAPGLQLAREHGDRGDYDVLWPAPDGATSAHAAAAPPPPSTFIVPEGQVFVLGDNRAAALDSRRFGTVPLADIEAIARQVWFSTHRGDGVRWSRIGKVLE